MLPSGGRVDTVDLDSSGQEWSPGVEVPQRSLPQPVCH